MQEEQAEGEEEGEEEDDEELPDVEALDYDDLNSVAKLQSSHRFQHLMEVGYGVVGACVLVCRSAVQGCCAPA